MPPAPRRTPHNAPRAHRLRKLLAGLGRAFTLFPTPRPVRIPASTDDHRDEASRAPSRLRLTAPTGPHVAEPRLSLNDATYALCRISTKRPHRSAPSIEPRPPAGSTTFTITQFFNPFGRSYVKPNRSYSLRVPL